MKISIISHYYNNQSTVLKSLASLKHIADRYPGVFDFVLVDDHSHEPVDPKYFEDVNGLRVFRIAEDVAWNMPAARNIGAREALCEKMLLIDIDHSVDPDQIDGLLAEADRLAIGQIGQFRRKKPTKSADHQWIEIASHINSFMINKADFVRVGGYEESFSGHYGHEDKFFKVCCRRHGLREVMLQTTLLVQGIATPKLDRDKLVNTDKLNRLLESKTMRAEKYLTYNWEQIHPVKSNRIAV